jgi:hypothetical protein
VRRTAPDRFLRRAAFEARTTADKVTPAISVNLSKLTDGELEVFMALQEKVALDKTGTD